MLLTPHLVHKNKGMATIFGIAQANVDDFFSDTLEMTECGQNEALVPTQKKQQLIFEEN